MYILVVLVDLCSAYMAYGSRTLDLIGWIWRVFLWFFSTVLLWMQYCVQELGGGISVNKAVFPFMRCESQEFWNLFCCLEEVTTQVIKLRRMEEKICIVSSTTSSITRFVNRGSVGGGTNRGAASVARRGGESRDGVPICASLLVESQQGRSFTSPGRFLTAALFSSLFNMAEGRPFPPSSPVTVFSGRRYKDLLNLQAAMPQRRPFCIGVASSRFLVPSGSIPGDVEVDCVELRMHHAGEGAGPNCFSLFRCKVLCISCEGLFVIFIFLESFYVNCSSGDQ